MSVVGGEASLDWLDLRRPEFDGSGLREDGDHDGYPFSVLLDSQDFALPASVRATDNSNLIARLHTHWHHLTEDSPLSYFSRVASALASDRANYQYTELDSTGDAARPDRLTRESQRRSACRSS